MPSYKLTYFKHWGRAGVLRLLFAAGEIEFEDVRIEREQWPELKPKTPMGQIPILEVDGTIICQTKAIGRLIAKEAGLAGKTPLEAAQVDMIVDGLSDLQVKIVDFFIEKDEKKKQEKIKEFAEKTLPMFLDTYEKLASSSGHFVGDALTWADVDFFSLMFFLKDHLPNDPLKGHVKLTKVKDNVTSNPGIAAWMEKETSH
ncbi:HPGDS [Branchiostoma lanceolatum]|uniref:glutathione transferase n=1 Tax=Branchiostoma lanceolatum TaxID=7740 RepID=A0A8K0EHM0_BRALA|nr:HPGDS [Branchiostoma lanceolatum]